MHVAALHLDAAAVEEEPLVCIEADVADAERGLIIVDRTAAAADSSDDSIEMWSVQIPEHRRLDSEILGHDLFAGGRESGRCGLACNDAAVRPLQFADQRY